MPQAPCLTPSPAVLPTAGSTVSTTISTTPPGPPRYCPAPPESGRNSCVLKKSGKRTSVTSRLPNLMPPAPCHSPPPGQPSPTGEAPPPGRAWKRCQMKGSFIRGSRPWMAMRQRRSQRVIARPDHGALAGDDLHRAEGAVVLRRLRVDEVGERHRHPRLHVG